MPKRSPQVDAYIAKAQPFARPILAKIRSLFHKASPKIEESIKWGVPFFEYKGIVGVMAGFKSHIRWGFWKAKLLNASQYSMGAGKITSISELPADKVIIDLVRKAVALNEQGAKTPKPSKPKKRPPPKVPAILAAALKKNPKAAAAFKAFSPSHQREYIEWIIQAKQEETRQRRVAQTVEWVSREKSRNWKYEKS